MATGCCIFHFALLWKLAPSPLLDVRHADVCSIEDVHAEVELITAHQEERQALRDLWFSLSFIGARPISRLTSPGFPVDSVKLLVHNVEPLENSFYATFLMVMVIFIFREAFFFVCVCVIETAAPRQQRQHLPNT